MARTWRFKARIDAPPEDVYRWLVDFRPDDHARPAFKRGAGVRHDTRGSVRTVVARDADRVVIEDTWGRQRFRVEAFPDAIHRQVRLVGQYGYEGVWRAEEADGGATRLTVTGTMAPRFPVSLFMGLFWRRLERDMRNDFNGHVEDLRESLRGGM